MNARRGIAVCLLLLVGPAGLQAQSRTEVRDGAGLFNAKTIAQVDQELREIGKVYRRDVVIETIKELPAKQRNLLDRAHSAKQAARLFGEWATEKARALGMDGVYILISTIPGYKHVQVTVWPDEQPLPLRWRDRDQVRRCFVEVESHKGANKALTDMVEELRDCLSKNLAADDTTATALTWWTLGLVSGAILILWGLTEMVRKKAKAGTGAISEEAARPDRALPGVMGEMFGTLAAQPIYDQAIQDQALEERPDLAPPPLVVVPDLPQPKAPEPSENELEPARQND